MHQVQVGQMQMIDRQQSAFVGSEAQQCVQGHVARSVLNPLYVMSSPSKFGAGVHSKSALMHLTVLWCGDAGCKHGT